MATPRLLRNLDYQFQVIDNSTSEFKDVERQFEDGWRHAAPTSHDGVLRILRLTVGSMKDWVYERRPNTNNFEMKCTELKQTRGNSNVRRLFHGASAECGFGIVPDKTGSLTVPCNSDQCAMCNLCCTGFNTLFCNANHPGRYGTGFPTSQSHLISDRSHSGHIPVANCTLYPKSPNCIRIALTTIAGLYS